MLSNYFSFQGRIPRKIFWKLYIINYVVGITSFILFLNAVSMLLSGENLLLFFLFQQIGVTSDFIAADIAKRVFLTMGVIAPLVLIFSAVSQYSVITRRLHDINLSAKVIIYFIIASGIVGSLIKTVNISPTISILIKVATLLTLFGLLGIIKGTSGPNKYGEDPLGQNQNSGVPIQNNTDTPIISSV